MFIEIKGRGNERGGKVPFLKGAACSEKAMAPYSSTLAWKIPWTEEPGRLQSMGSLESDTTERLHISLFTFMHWRRKWQPTPVFLLGESQGRGGGLPSMGLQIWTRLKRLSSSSSSSLLEQPDL